jgi:alpha-D-xyloside xylohydrolase
MACFFNLKKSFSHAISKMPDGSAGRARVALLLAVLFGSVFASVVCYASTYATWKAQVFTPADQSNPAVSGETGNPSGDGISNLEKYAYGLNPYQNAVTGSPTLSLIQQNSQTYLGLTFQAPSIDPPTDLLYIPQVSTDLVNWSQGSPGISLYSMQGPTNGSNFYTYIAGNLPVGSNQRAFMRLQLAEAAVIDVASGTYGSPQTVTIIGPPNATLYYTTDGSTPTSSSLIYTGPITVSSSETLQVQAYLNGVPYGGVAVATYTITPSGSTAIPVVSAQQTATGATLTMSPGLMQITVCSDSIIRVMYSPTSTMPSGQTFSVNATWTTPAFQFSQNSGTATVASAKVQVVINKATGAVNFYDSTGAVLLQEPANGGKTMTPATVNGESSYKVTQVFNSPSDEYLYGLGQYQEGTWNWRGMPQQIRQYNTQIAVPIIVSNKGYGVFWNNASITDFNPADAQISLNNGNGTYKTGTAGEYVFFTNNGNRGGEIGITVNGQSIVDISGGTIPAGVSGKINLAANTTYNVSVIGGGSLSARLLGSTTTFRSEVGDAIDYYFFYGPTADQVVADCRLAMGDAPLLPKAAYGYWQCKDHYNSQSDILNAAAEFRSLQIPVDIIVQDWQYWPSNASQAYQYDPSRYPNPASMLSQLHSENFTYMISVWSDPGGTLGATLAGMSQGLIPGTNWMDVFNPAVRQARWNAENSAFFSIGADAFWQDATEPNEDAGMMENNHCYAGSGNRVHNAYSLYASQATYEGWRATTNNKRVVVLTRSGYAGQQRYAAATWSGDLAGTWGRFAQQIPAGLNYCLTGSPYWTTDTGGYFQGSQSDPAFNELVTRWYQWSTFCPILRIHGGGVNTEIWNWLSATQPNLIASDKLRYSMLPYNYSVAWQTTSQRYTPMRALMMDFPSDQVALGISNEFMFGPAFLVNPVTTAGATTRSVYLPKGTNWIDFWTGVNFNGGQIITSAAPIDHLPLYIRAGSIVPLGPDVQYAIQTPDPIELRVYPGANGQFTLYEDDNATYSYETGSYATIPMTWNDASKQLTIGARQGSFPGMLQSRTFRVMFVHPGHAAGVPVGATADQVVTYNGSAATVTMPNTPAPSAISGLTVTVVIAQDGTEQPTLNWNAATGADNYLIERGTQSGGPYTLLGNTNGLSYVDSGAPTGFYYYVVVPVNIGGTGPVSAEVSASVTPAPIVNGWNFTNIGAVGITGNATFSNGTYTVTASGDDIWNTADAFRFGYQTLNGNGSVIARVGSVQNTNAWTKAGVMIRASVAANDANAAIFVTPGNGISFQWRSTAGGSSSNVTAGGVAPYWVKLTQSGNTFTGYYSTNGVNWTQLGASQTITMGSSVLAGMATTSHDNSNTAVATYTQVSVVPTGQWAAVDIGSPSAAGSTVFNGSTGTYTVQGSGGDIQGSSDQFHFASVNWTGNGIFIARVADLTNTNPWTKAGLMVRASQNGAGDINFLEAITPGSGSTAQSRTTTNGGTTWSQTTGLAAPYWVKIVKSGTTYTAFHSSGGTTWTQEGSSSTLTLPTTFYVGLALTSHSDGQLATAHFDNVTFTATP